MLAVKNFNLARLFSNHNPFCFSLPFRLLSTLTDERQVISGNGVYDVLVQKHKFCPQLAAAVSSELSRYRSPERADSTLSFLKGVGFSSSQLEKMVKYHPRILTASREDDIKLRIRTFQVLGLSSEDIAKIVCRNLAILKSSVKNRIIPSLSLLNGVLGSDRDVARVFKKNGWFLFVDLEKTLVPNVEILKSCGMAMEDIRYFIHMFPRCVLKCDILAKSIDKAKEMGVIEGTKTFIIAVGVIASTNEETWRMKFQGLRDLGFSDSDILSMFNKAPRIFCLSTLKIKQVMELLLATGKFDMSSITDHPTSFAYSIHKRYKPRLHILGTLESRNLIEKWPSLGTISTWTDDRFFQTFVKPYSDELAKDLPFQAK